MKRYIHGTHSLMMLYFRQNRIFSLIWLLLPGLWVTINTFSSLILFPTQEELEEMSVSLIDPLTEAMHGPLLDISIAGFVTWRTKVFLVLVVGIFSIVYMIRHTRLAEEQGKRELWGAYLIYINGDFLGAAADFRSPLCFFIFFMDYASKSDPVIGRISGVMLGSFSDDWDRNSFI